MGVKSQANFSLCSQLAPKLAEKSECLKVEASHNPANVAQGHTQKHKKFTVNILNMDPNTFCFDLIMKQVKADCNTIQKNQT